MNRKKVVIIGAGPAGIAAAIQLKRYGIEPIVLEKENVGGLLRNANMVENYPGFPKGIKGLDLVELFKKQLQNIDIEVSFEKVLKLEYRNKMFFTKTNRREIISDFAVIATGTIPRRISIPPITDDIKDRVFYEIYSIIRIKNKKIAIIGAGDCAFDYALNLSRRNKVIILNRSNRTKCIPILWERCSKSENIKYWDNAHVNKINNDGDKLLLTCKHENGQNKNQIYVDYVAISIGREPCLEFLGAKLKKNFEILIKAKLLYMIGDVKNEIYRQTAICVGDGIKAAMEIYENIEREGE